MSQSCNITIASDRVVLKHNGLAAGFSWGACEELYRVVKRLSEFSEAYASHKDHAQVKNDYEEVCSGLTVHRMGLEFTFELAGRIWFRCPYTTARQIAGAVLAKAREIEEVENAKRVIEDQALLLRTGLPIGLTYNRKINREAWKQAEDVDFPGAKIPAAIFHPPTIILGPPKTPVLQE